MLHLISEGEHTEVVLIKDKEGQGDELGVLIDPGLEDRGLE